MEPDGHFDENHQTLDAVQAHSARQVAEDRFLRIMPPEECMAIRMKAPKTPTELVGALKCTLATLNVSKQEATKPQQTPTLHFLGQKGGPEGIPPCPTHPPLPLEESMLTVPEPRNWLAGYIVHSL